MVSSLLAIILAWTSCYRLPRYYRFFVFALVLAALMPLVGYVVFGACQVFQKLSLEQFFMDLGFILKNCLAEPVNLFRGQATDWQFALPGTLMAVCFVWGIAVLSFNQRHPEEKRVH